VTGQLVTRRELNISSNATSCSFPSSSSAFTFLETVAGRLSASRTRNFHQHTMFAILLSLCLLTVHGLATLTVNLPLQDQLAPTARVGQPYSWTFSNRSFTVDSGATLVLYCVWTPLLVVFQPGNPYIQWHTICNDEGLPRINVTARQGSSSATVSSYFSICVSSYAAPTLNVPLETQFQQSNPSLSSVFVLDSTSALFLDGLLCVYLRLGPSVLDSRATPSATLSVMRSRKQMVQLPPSWLRFDNVSGTLSGVAPYIRSSDPPTVIPLSLHGIDQNGYSSAQSPFDVVVAAHELRSVRPLPTINVTTAAPFNLSLWCVTTAFQFTVLD
jgi:axial budding pattern protein 2